MIPIFPAYKNLELSDKDEIEKITKLYPPYSDYHFTQMWIWDVYEPLRLSKLNDNLIIRQSDALTGESFYSFLGAERIDNTINTIFDYLSENNLPRIIKWIPEEIVDNSNGFAASMIEDRDNHDYILDVSQLFHAEGKKYKKYRKKIKKYEKKHSKLNIRPQHLPDSKVQTQINNLFSTWTKQVKPENKIGDSFFEHKALNKLLFSANEFDSFSSVGIYDKDDLIACFIYEIINENYAISPFVIANRDYEGSFQYIFKKAIETLHKSGIKYLNFEPDFGVSSWRTYKMSYNPNTFLKKYKIETDN